MALDIDAIGLSMDTSGVERGIKSLDDLAARGPKVEKSLSDIEQAAKSAGKGVSDLRQGNAGKGLKDVSDQADKAAQGLNKTTTAVTGAGAAMRELGLALGGAAQAYTQFQAAAKDTALEGDKARAVFESIAKASAVMVLYVLLLICKQKPLQTLEDKALTAIILKVKCGCSGAMSNTLARCARWIFGIELFSLKKRMFFLWKHIHPCPNCCSRISTDAGCWRCC